MRKNQLHALVAGAMSLLTFVPGLAAPPAGSPYLTRRAPQSRTETQPTHDRHRAPESPVKAPMVPRMEAGRHDFRSYSQTASPTLLPTGRRQAPMRVTSAEAGRIYGGAIYAENWTSDNQPIGIYSFDFTDATTVRPEVLGEDYVVTGGVYANGKYHFVSYMAFMGMVMGNLYTCDIETWTIERNLPIQPGSIPQDMAYDPTTGAAYGCFMNDNADGWVMGSLNLETGERRLLKDLDLIILSVGVNSKGELYGVGLDGNFYRFDKNTGDRTLVGPTGHRPMYSASGCFDLTTDRFYWECIEADSRAVLYEIDVNTGKAEYISDIADNMEMVGMFIPVAEAADAAPAAVTEVSVSFPDGGMSGEVVFTMPTMQFDGLAPLAGELGYVVSVDDVTAAEGTAQPGAEVRVPVEIGTVGTHRFNVTVSNEAGKSPVTLAEYWIGHDMPLGVGALTLNVGETDNTMSLTWEAPTATAHGGFVDPSEITYTVVRYPDEVTVAEELAGTTFSEVLADPEKITLYYYAVIPEYLGSLGEASLSNQVAVGYYTAPMANALNTESKFSFFKVIDANGDGETWLFDTIHEAARIKYSLANNFTEPMDDWLVTPRIYLKAGRMYHFSFNAATYGPYYTERVEVKMGTEATPEGMTIQVVAPTSFASGSDNDGKVPMDAWVQVEEDGCYYFGIHAISKADTMYLYASDVRVEEGPVIGTPGAVTSFTAKAADKGALAATLTFTAPLATVDGKPLDEITEVTVLRNDRFIGTLTDVKPGQTVTYVDEASEQGENVYAVAVANSVGEGYTTETSVYVGHDRPGLPINVVAKEVDGNVVLTWDAPAEGETGGYYDPAAVTYTVLRANDEVELVTGLKDLTFTDVNPPLYGYRQEFMRYYVYAQSPAGYGYGQVSNMVTVGEPFAMPFVETFADGRINNDPWDVNIPDDSEGYWQLRLTGEYPDAQSQDPEGGLVSFIPEEEGDTGTLMSGKIDVTGASNPVVDFWWYYVPDTYDTLTLLLSKDGGDFAEIGQVRFRNEEGEPGWRRLTVPMTGMEGVKYVQIAFEAYSVYGYTNIHLDNIRVMDMYDHNLAATALKVPARMKTGEESILVATIENVGVNSADAYEVALNLNGVTLMTVPGNPVASSEVTEVKFAVTPDVTWPETAEFTAQVVYDADMWEGDNRSPVATSRISIPNLPSVNDLAATMDEAGGVNLEWTEPEVIPGTGEVVTDSAEDYRSFSINNFGDWLVYDGDKYETYGIANATGGALQYENAGKPMAFMVFNPESAGIDLEYEDGTPTGWAPHSGDQMFASFGSDEQSDDWLISPELPGIEQTVSFWVKSVTTDYGFEKFEVLASSTGCDLTDFSRIGDVRSAPGVWREETVVLPQGTRYFAIRCISKSCYAFLLDDITYLPATSYTEELALVGYNIYRDGVKLNDEPVMEMEWSDTPADSKPHTYSVTVVYDKGESRFSNEVTVSPSGVESAESGTVKVYALRGAVRVVGAMDADVTVATADGRVVTRFTGTGDDRVALLPGLYIVRVDGASGVKSTKLIVR